MKLLSLALLLRETSADNACEMKCSREHGGRSSALARNCFFGCQFNPDPDTDLLPSSTTIQVTTTTEDSEGTGVACHMNCTRKFAGRSHSKEARNCFFDCEETTGTSGTTTTENPDTDLLPGSSTQGGDTTTDAVACEMECTKNSHLSTDEARECIFGCTDPTKEPDNDTPVPNGGTDKPVDYFFTTAVLSCECYPWTTTTGFPPTTPGNGTDWGTASSTADTRTTGSTATSGTSGTGTTPFGTGETTTRTTSGTGTTPFITGGTTTGTTGGTTHPTTLPFTTASHNSTIVSQPTTEKPTSCAFICGRSNVKDARACQLQCSRLAQVCNMNCGNLKGRAKKDCLIECETSNDPVEFSTLATPDDTTTAAPTPCTSICDSCPTMEWKGGKYSKPLYEAENAFVIKVNVPNTVPLNDIRLNNYGGFLIFSRRWCGIDFLNGIMDESVVVSLTDSQAMYTIVDKYHRLDSVKNRQSVTIQYRQDRTYVTESYMHNDLPNTWKKDQFMLVVASTRPLAIKNKANCFKIMTGVLPYHYVDSVSWAQCAGNQKDVGY